MTTSESNFKGVWLVGGWIFFALALIGLALPVIPQVPFAIVAAYCFSKGSPKLHAWLVNHKTMGPPIRDWEEHRVLRPKLKLVSSLALVAGAGLSVYLLREYDVWLRITVPALMIASIIFVVTRKSRP